MRIIRKILFLSVIFTLISSSFSFPFEILASENIQNEQFEGKEAKVIIEQDDENVVYLYESQSVDSEILMTLENGDNIILINQDETFSFVAVFNDEEVQITGYILNEFIEIINDESEVNEENESLTDDEVADDEKITEEEVNKETRTDDEEIIERVEKNNISLTSLNETALQGIALKNETYVYEEQSRNSKRLRAYSAGTILKYYELNKNWYRATVKYEGKWTTGYLHKDDVETVTGESNSLNGIALKQPTYVYEKASKNSKALRQYAVGSVLKYRTFSSNWYIATVYINGVAKTGYIYKADVENVVDNQQSLRGISLKDPTRIYTRASTGAPVHKTYRQGSVLIYKTFTKDWYEAVVYVNGQRKRGFIHKNDVEQAVKNQEQIQAWAIKSVINGYERATRNSKVIRSYKKGQMLKLKTLSKNWYEGTVKYNNKWVKAYFHASDISLVNATYTEYNLTLKEMVDIQLKGAPQTDKKYAWVSKSYIKNNEVTASELNVRLGPGTNYKSIDTIKEGTRVNILDEYNGWYVIEFNHNSQWTHASPKDVMTYLNPANYMNDERQKFQFLDLSRQSGASVTVLNKFLNGKGTLSGQGKAFIDASKKYGVNDIYLLSHAILETGHGQSNLAQGIKVGLDNNNNPQLVTDKNEKELTNIKTVYNMFGVRAFDSCPDSCGAKYAYEEGWDTPYKAIVGGAAFISSDYIQGKNNEGTVLNTLYKMRWNPEFAANHKRYGKQYATDIGWAVKQVNTMYNLYQEIGELQLVLDIPVYLK